MIRVLIVDDVRSLAEQYAYDLERVGGYAAVVATSGAEALERIPAEAVDCVILDLEMPGVDGFEVLQTLRKRGEQVPVIVYTGTGNYDRCVRAVRLGAAGFIDKAEPMERVVQEVENVVARRRLEAEVASLREDLGRDTPLIGDSGPMRDLRRRIERVAAIPSPVLIEGESGSGKELVAREIHRLGPDPKRPFVAINSAALPANLVESELFGHERGAFTGAGRTHRGAFEQASGGTLFLDEIGELPPAAQAKLLRVLEDGRVRRVGGERDIEVVTRIVAATNRDLASDSEAGRFRADLFYRLNVHILRVPPLRERRSDIPALAHHFLTAACARFGVRPMKIEPAALAALTESDWRRNNVRELRNIIERLIIATDGGTIRLGDIPVDLCGGHHGPRPPGAAPRTFRELKAEAERQILVTALEHNDWQITRTAKALGLADHASLLKIIRRHGLKRPP